MKGLGKVMQNVMERKLGEYMEYMEREEKSSATRKQYEREIRRFISFQKAGEWTKELVIQYKETLCGRYQPSSVNAKIAALNSFFTFIGKAYLKVKALKIQKKVYCPKEKELTKVEYNRLLETARRQKNQRLFLLLQTICGTGIRVSEVQFITGEAVEKGEAIVNLKGKTRTILISGKLRKALQSYMKSERITSGPVFVTKSGKPLDRSNIWKMMKGICKDANVEEGKVFPHNLRHLFARCFYSIDKDIVRLADVLGHSNINTTRIYIISSGQEHRKRLEALHLVM